MLFILGILTCLVGGVLGMLILLYQKVERLTIIGTNRQAQEYVIAAQTPKRRERIFAPKTTVATKDGRAVKDQPQLTDISDVDTETAINALEMYGDQL